MSSLLRTQSWWGHLRRLGHQQAAGVGFDLRSFWKADERGVEYERVGEGDPALTSYLAKQIPQKDVSLISSWQEPPPQPQLSSLRLGVPSMAHFSPFTKAPSQVHSKWLT